MFSVPLHVGYAGLRCERLIQIVHVDRDTALAADALREPDVVRVRVGQDDGAHIVQGPTHGGELGGSALQ